MSDLVYYGVWINWSRGKVDGSTITLSPRNAGILVAFLAIFVSVAGGSVWRILSFIIHQRCVSKAPRDGLHYQQQAILRNAATPGVASWQLMWLVSPWWKLSKRPFWRSFPLIILTLINLSVFFAAGILVAEVTRTTGTEVLVRSDNCGNWTLSTTQLIYALQSKTLNNTISAANYARACYGGPSNALECNQYETQSLPYTRSQNDPCPFADGICLRKFSVFTLDTSNISSHDHLGVNTQSQDRITYRRRTTCAPLQDTGFITTFNCTDAQNQTLGDFNCQEGDVMDFYNFGPTVWKTRSPNNYTFAYNRRAASVGYGYNLAAVDHTSGDGDDHNLWEPDEAVARNDGDVSLMFLSANDVLYLDKVEDPIFRATADVGIVMDAGVNRTLYTSNYFVNPLGCVDQHQFCNPVTGKCTKLDSYSAAVRSAQAGLQLNAMQYVTVSTFSLDLYLPIISQSIGGRGSAALRAQEIMSGLISGPLPKDQWMEEVEYWFTTGLAKLQQHIVEYATGPINVLDGAYVSKPNDTAAHQLCESQKIKAPPGSGATSFSTLGVAIILAVGGLLILTHTILEYLVSSVITTRNQKLVRCALDEKLQLQRLAFEGAGMGSWNTGIGSVPTTTGPLLFGMEVSSVKDHPTLSTITDEEKQVVVVTENTDSPTTPSMSKSQVNSERNDSLQLPPLDLDGDRQGMWPLVDEGHDWNAHVTPDRRSQPPPPHHQDQGNRI